MPFVLSVVNDPNELDDICPMAYDAWKVPYNPQLKHFQPEIEDRDEAIQEMKERYSKRLQDGRIWCLKVVDPDNSKVVGSAFWAVESPSAEDPPAAATWYPEGSVERKFAERFINGLHNFLNSRVPRKHLDLLSIITDPKYRHKGVGRMMIRWGTAKADELGIETVISSLPFAREAYKKCGMGEIEGIPPDVDVANPSERWKELQSDNLSGYLMWRPVGRDFVPGQDKAPWE